MFTDIADQDISVGDIVAYTASAGQAVSSINVGEVTRFTAKSLWVKDVDPETFRIKIVDDVVYEDDHTKPYQRYDGSIGYRQRRRVIGRKEIDETIVGNPAPHRFLILRKI